MKSCAVRLLIADQHEIFRASLCKLLESEGGLKVVGEASDGAEAVALARRLRPDFLLLDLAMPNMRGFEALRELAALASSCRIVLLAAAIEGPQIVEALRLGARGVMLKSSAANLLFKCIRTVMAGEYWVARESVADLVVTLRQGRQAQKESFGLTPREAQVVTQVVAGYSNKEIARHFSIGEDTVKHHVSNIFDKLDVVNRLELALFAVNHGLAD